jgi:imidazoleglycerol-phosphate dehydratase
VRRATTRRATAETRVEAALDLDGAGASDASTGVPFFDHMLAQLARHSGFDVRVAAEGDLAVDAHHTVEDVGIALGAAFREALGDARGIARFASLHAPMDDALVLCALDVSGRPYLHFDVSMRTPTIGAFPSELVEEFFRAFATHARVTLHVVGVHGRNSHHLAEAAFKGLAVALGRATRVEHDALPSTKGTL